MRKYLTKKSMLATLVLAIAITAVAVAYLSAGGSGSGTGDVTETADAMTLTSEDFTLTHIGDFETIDITAANSGSSPQQLSALHVKATPANSSCPAGSFTATEVDPNEAEVPAGGSAVVGTVKISFVNNASAPQNDCISGTGDQINLALSSTPIP